MGWEGKSTRLRKWEDASPTTSASETPAVEGQWDGMGHGFEKTLV